MNKFQLNGTPSPRLLHRTPCGRVARFERLNINMDWNPVPAIYAFIKGPSWLLEPRVSRWIYIGETDDLKRRMCDHLRDPQLSYFLPDAVLIAIVRSETDRKIIEKDMIQRYRPMKNIQHNGLDPEPPTSAGIGGRPLTAGFNRYGIHR